MTPLFERHSLFKSLSKEHLVLLEALSTKENFNIGTVILQEGEISSQFYLITKGEVEILKQSEEGKLHRIRNLKAGDLIGELAFIEKAARSATVKALTETEVIRIDGETIKQDPRFIGLYAELVTQIAKLVSERLRYTNNVTVKSMQDELKATKSQIAMGYTMMSIITLSATYIFSLGLVSSLNQYLPSTTPITIGFLILFSVVLLLSILHGGYPLQCYGMSLHRWPHVALQAILYSLPVMAGILLLKVCFVQFLPSYAQDSIFQPFLVLRSKPNPEWVFIVIPLAYAIFCPIQEFVVRGALQSSLQMFLRNTGIWTPILLSNLLFASAHIHTTFAFAMMAFIPGLFWGWLYSKQQNLIGVSISHILIGLWAVFVVGFKSMI